MIYDLSLLKQKIKDTEDWLQKEYFSVRTGRSTPTVLDGIKVESYGALVQLNQVANVSVEDAKTLRILPYDASQIKEIEKAIVASNLGLSTSSDDNGLRISFPELTTESRESLIKAVKEKLEKARISLRSERDEVWGDIQKQEKAGEIAEDEKFRLKDEMQKYIDEGNKKLDEIAKNKEQELRG